MTKTIEELRQRAQEVAELDKERGEGISRKYYEFIAHAPSMAQLIADQQEKIEELWERFRDVDDIKTDLAFKYNDLLLRMLQMQKEEDNDTTL